MLMTVTIFLVLLYAPVLVTSYLPIELIHILLVVAAVVVLVKLMQEGGVVRNTTPGPLVKCCSRLLPARIL